MKEERERGEKRNEKSYYTDYVHKLMGNISLGKG